MAEDLVKNNIIPKIIIMDQDTKSVKKINSLKLIDNFGVPCPEVQSEFDGAHLTKGFWPVCNDLWRDVKNSGNSGAIGNWFMKKFFAKIATKIAGGRHLEV
jgi:hypothetical protein